MRLCIVGGGLTGAVSAASLREALPHSHIELWDKARTFGGRMCTKTIGSEAVTSSVDVGAQYISSSPANYTLHYHSHYSRLLSAGVLRPMTCVVKGDRHCSNTRHFVAPKGMASIVQHYVDNSLSKHKLETELQNVSLSDSSMNIWQLVSKGGTSEEFDTVLLTLPVPQILALQGDIQLAIDEVKGLRESLENVSYSSRFCLGLFYSAADSAKITLPDNAGAIYLTGDDSFPFCYLALDNVRRGEQTDGASVLVHTTRQFGGANVERTKEEMLPELMERFKQLMTDWPQPQQTFCHKWRYSQVTNCVASEMNGSVSLRGGSLVLSGDAFTQSNVDGCFAAACSATMAVLQNTRHLAPP